MGNERVEIVITDGGTVAWNILDARSNSWHNYLAKPGKVTVGCFQ